MDIAEDPHGYGGCHPGLTAVDGVDPPRDLQGLGVGPQASDGAGLNRPQELLVGIGTAQDEDGDTWPGGGKAANGLDGLDPRLRQGKQDDVGAREARQLDRELGVGSFADDLDSIHRRQE
jgi:hypothetical protein